MDWDDARAAGELPGPEDAQGDHRPAFESLLNLVRPIARDEDVVVLTGSEGQDVPWHALYPLAAVHRVVPLVYRRLQAQHANAVPPDVISALRNHHHANALMCVQTTRTMLDVHSALAAVGVEALVFKGPALAAMAYGESGWREYSDIDLLVRRGDLRAADECLNDLGWRQRAWPWPLSGTGGWVLGVSNKELSYQRGPAEIAVDLHWRLVDSETPGMPPTPGDVWRRKESVELLGRAVPAMGPEDMLLTIASHEARHGWAHLRGVCDVAVTSPH